ACAATYDAGAQFLWRAVRGKALARLGALDEGERLARRAAELAAVTDSVSQRAHVLFDLAEVLRMSGRGDEAVEAVDEAVELLEKKGNVAAGRRAHAVLA